MEIKKLIDQVKAENLPIGEYAVFGSATLAIRGLREAPNIDLIVTDRLWTKLLETGFSPDNEGFIRINLIKISNWWFAETRKNIPTMIKEAELIDGIPFVRFDEVRWYKSKLNREKDKEDVRLIDQFLNCFNEKPFNLDTNTYKSLLDLFVKKSKSIKEITSMVVFGSVSRGQAKGDSDIDIFVYYKGNREKINQSIVQIIINLRTTFEYNILLEKGIEPEIYPFLISEDEIKTNGLPWVAYDSIISGQIIYDTDDYAKNIIKKYQTALPGRKVNLPDNKGWCWLINKQNMERSQMFMDASKESLQEAKDALNRNSFNIAIRRCQETIELGISGILSVVKIHYPKNHDQAPFLKNILKARGIEIDQKLETISADLSRKRGPALHQEEGYDKDTATKAISDAEYALNLIEKYFASARTITTEK